MRLVEKADIGVMRLVKGERALLKLYVGWEKIPICLICKRVSENEEKGGRENGNKIVDYDV